MSIVPLRWGVTYIRGFRYTAYVAIFCKDGTIAITHGGVEIGQGIDTKVLRKYIPKLGAGILFQRNTSRSCMFISGTMECNFVRLKKIQTYIALD